MASKVQKQRVTLRLSVGTASLLEHAGAHEYGGMSRIAERAIASFFEPEGDERFSIMVRRLDQMQKDHRRLAEDQVVVMQAVNTFVWFYLLMTPPVPVDDEPAAKALALKRYEDYLHRLGKDVRGEAHLSDLVLSENDEEGGVL